MTIARSLQIDLTATRYYHCMSRCVRGAFLCGEDLVTGKDYSHRRGWIANRIKELTQSFAIDIAAYAVMSNHYHVVLHVKDTQAREWKEEEVITRWGHLFPHDARRVSALPETLQMEKITLWRERLSNVSWYMRCLNEKIARLSNKEEESRGRFWEGRFKSQALLDEGALLSAMAYVDLNPIRANLALTPETSQFTSVQERIKTHIKALKYKADPGILSQPLKLMPFMPTSQKESLPFTLPEYLTLVDTTGRYLREDKKGAIPLQLAPILSRLHLSVSGYLRMVSHLEENFSYAVGQAKELAAFSSSRHRVLKGMRAAKACYLPPVA